MKVEIKKLQEPQWEKNQEESEESESYSKINSYKRTFKAMFILFKHWLLVVLTIIWNKCTIQQEKN